MEKKTTPGPLRSPAETAKTSRSVRVSRNGRKSARKGIATDGLALASPPGSYEALIARQFSSIPNIDAVFVYEADDGLVHVYSIVPDFSFELYKKLQGRE